MFSFVYRGIDFAHKLDNSSIPSEDFSKHLHTFFEILYFVRGRVHYTVESETRKLNEGDLILIAPGKYHFATVDLSAPYERYVLKFPKKILPDFMLQKIADEDITFLEAKSAKATLDNFDGYYHTLTRDELFIVFICETLKVLTLSKHSAIKTTEKQPDIVKQIIDYINANLQKPLTMQDIVSEFHYSRSYISMEFKKHMQISIMQYIRYKKIIAVHELVLNGAKKQETAELYGFGTYSTFYRAYKKLVSDNEMTEQPPQTALFYQ